MGDRRPRRGRGGPGRAGSVSSRHSVASSAALSQGDPHHLQHIGLINQPHMPVLQPLTTPEPSQQQGPSAPKIAIPRLRRESEVGSAGSASRAGDKHRVSHACEPCRQRKTKCTGERPVCKHCHDFKIACYYADGKRDRAKRELGSLTQRVEKYEDLLRQLSSQLDSAGQLAVQMALTRSPSPDGESTRGARSVDLDGGGGENLVSAEVGSVGSLDQVDEDVNATEASRAAGYMGKNSDVTWMQRIRGQLLDTSSGTGATSTDIEAVAAQADADPHSAQTATHHRSPHTTSDLLLDISTYHLDDLNLSLIGDHVDPYALPLRPTADQLIKSYFDTVHPSFPIVLRPLFKKQYDIFFKSYYPPDSSRRWLAMLNLIFAIGAYHSHLIKAEWRGDDRDHLQFFARARMLALDNGAIFEMPDLQQVQVVGLTGMYLLASNQTNRAWNVIGLAIRYAQSLGLHLKNTTESLSDVQREMRVRIWYSIYSIERLLCAMCGRPTAIPERDCSTPLPLPIEEELFPADGGPLTTDLTQMAPPQSRDTRSPIDPPSRSSQPTSAASSAPASAKRTPQSSSKSESPTSYGSGSTVPYTFAPPSNACYFMHRTKLNMLTAEVLGTLYAADTVNLKWSQAQALIGEFDVRLSKWKSELPSAFDFGRRQRDQTFLRQRMSLGFMYYSAKAIINRPCLCRSDRRIVNESNKSKELSRLAALACVDAARSSLQLIPDEPNPGGLYQIAPWWCVLHYLVQAGTVLIIELAFRAEHMPHEAEGILKDAKKVVLWLRAMSADSLAARRSWASLNRLLRLAAPKIGGDTREMPQDAPEAPPSEMEAIEQSGAEHTVMPHHFHEHDIWNQEQFMVEQPPMSFSSASGVQVSYPYGHMPIATSFDQFMPIQGQPIYTDADISSMFPTSTQIESLSHDQLGGRTAYRDWAQSSRPPQS